MKPASRTTALAASAVVLATAGGLLAGAAPAFAVVNCPSPVYKRQFFANTTFSGTPKKTDCDSMISEKWGTGAPVAGLPKDNFSVRWSVTRDFGSGGPFSLPVTAQDGVRVYLDGTRKLDLWKNVSTPQKKTVNVTVPAGQHTLRVDFVHWTGKAEVNFVYEPRISAGVDKVAPRMPTGPSTTYDRNTGKARTSWSRNKEMDLGGYRVYRRVKGASFGTKPLATTIAASYTDGSVPATGETYYYEVRAYDKAGNESAGTADQAVTTVDRTAPAAPSGLTAAAGTNGLLIGWHGVTGAVSYRVYRAVGSDGAFAQVATTDQVSYRDTSAVDGVSYYYRVTALDAAGNQSGRSAVVGGRSRDLVAPPAVTGLTVTPTEYGFDLGWDANPAADIAKYTVHRGEIIGDEGEEQRCFGSLVEYLWADTTSYTYTGLPDGERACFYIDAIDAAGNSSLRWTGTAEAVSATELDMTPSVPTPEGSPLDVTVYAAEGDEGNEVRWRGLGGSAPEAAGGYRVHRWNPATAAYERIAELGSGAFVYFDTGARRGTTSYYWVTAVAADGTESLPSGDWAVTAPPQR
ncbi:PA14 domain-containing protein [Streptomyces lushanensis]|uniref:PA14 domain-containing protein n=1 Tax=Streptomyces lushanensis TaxID=1434255 RepID=UPI00082AD66D|nr:PA14 domain-containing protein [Streptomyces lushanensis]